MGKDTDSTFDFDMDSEFSKNFYKNIEIALGNSDVEVKDAVKIKKNTTEAKPDYIAYEKINQEKKQNRVWPEEEETQQEKETMEAAAAKTGKNVELHQDIDDALVLINANLARQICEEMDGTEAVVQNKSEKKLLFRIRNRIFLILLCFIGIGFFLGCTTPGNHLLLKMGVNLTGTIWSTMTGNFEDEPDLVEDTDYLDADDLSSDAPELDPSTIIWPDHPGDGRHEEGVYNILLLGEEAIGSGSGRGRTDVIVVATMNTITKELKLTSLMRDTFVQIPGFQDNKLNSAYEKGGLDLLYETIALNFDLQLDGCVLVNFEKFENIIDKLGGLEITLTSGEAAYLRKTNYISNPANRNVVEGTQLMNGNQVLGYARVRKRATITGNNNDYGRTDRHRIILNAIFDKYKTKGKIELAAIMMELLPMITSDIDSDCFELLLNSFIEMGTTEITQLRIPADGAFDGNAKVRGMSVLIPDLEANIEILHSFIFGEKTLATGEEENSASFTVADNSLSQ